MSLHGTPNDGHPEEGQECWKCGQRVPVRFRDIVKDMEVRVLSRRIPGTTWVRLSASPRWERPNYRPLVKGIVLRYGLGPFVLTVMPGPDTAHQRRVREQWDG